MKKTAVQGKYSESLFLTKNREKNAMNGMIITISYRWFTTLSLNIIQTICRRVVGIVDKRRMAVEKVSYSRDLIQGFQKKGVVLSSSLKMLKEADRELSSRHFEKAIECAKRAQDDGKSIYRDHLRSEDLKKKIKNIRKSAPTEVSDTIDASIEEYEKHIKAGKYKQFNREAEDLIRQLKSGADLIVKKRPAMKKKKSVSREDAASYLQAIALETLEAQKSGLPTSDLEQMLRDARDLIEGGFFRESMNTGKEAMARIDELRKQHEEYVHQVAAATEAIQSLKGQGLKTGSLEKLLGKARKSLDNVNYPKMTEHLNRLYEKMEDSKDHHTESIEIIRSTEVLITEAGQAGASLGFATSLLEEAQMLADKGDYAQAKKIGKEAHDEAVKSIQISLEKIKREEADADQVQALIDEGREAISETSQYVPVPAASEMLEKAIEMLKDHEAIDEARRLATDAKAMALETKKQYIETTEKVQEANKILTRLREAGLRPQSQQDMLVQALGAIDENNYLEALRLSKKVLKDLSAMDKERVDAEESLERARGMVNDVVGILETEEIDEMLSILDRGQSLATNGAFKEAASQAGTVIEKLEDMVSTNRDEFIKAKEKLSEVKMAVQLLTKEGVVTEQLMEILSSAEDELRGKEFKKAMEALGILDELITALRDAYDRSKTMLTAVRMVLDGMKERGLDVSRFEETYAQAKELFDKGDYEAAFGVGEGIQKESMPDLASYETIEDASAYIAEIRRNMHMIREGLPEVVDVEEKLGISGIFKEYYRRLLYSVIDGALRDVERADGMITEGKTTEAKDLAEKAMKMSENVGARYRDALEFLYQAKTIINEVEGPELSKLESIYKQAKAAMEQADYDRTMRLSEDVVKRAEPLIDRFQTTVKPLDGSDISIRPLEADGDVPTATPAPDGIPANDVRNTVDRTWAIIREFEKIGLDISVEKELMQAAEDAVQGGSFEEAIKISEQVKISVVTKGESLLVEEAEDDPEATAARNTLDRCQLLVDHMEENEITHKSVGLLLSRGEEAFGEGRFSAAITFAEEAINKADRVIEDWQKAEFMLKIADEEAAGSEKDVSTLMQSAVTEFESRNFRYAMRLTERIFDMLGTSSERYEFSTTPVTGAGSSKPVAAPEPAPPEPEPVPEPKPVPEPEPEPSEEEPAGEFEKDWDSFESDGGTEWLDDAPAEEPDTPEPEPSDEPAVAIVEEPKPAPAKVKRSAPKGKGSVSKEEWLEDQKDVTSTLMKLKEMYLNK